MINVIWYNIVCKSMNWHLIKLVSSIESVGGTPPFIIVVGVVDLIVMHQSIPVRVWHKSTRSHCPHPTTTCCHKSLVSCDKTQDSIFQY